jgi:hypothetical protein
MFLQLLTGTLLVALSRDQVIRSLTYATLSPFVKETRQKELELATLENSHENTVPITFQQALELINKRCPMEYINAVKRSGNFLYRGESLPFQTNRASCYMIELSPDLLSPKTYGCTRAIEYFQALEDCSTHLVRPSTSHIASSSLQDASLWGNPVSIWPIGTSFLYAFPKHTSNFIGCNTLPSSVGPSPPCDGIEWNEHLEKALSIQREVMFTTLDWFEATNEKTIIVACPAPLYNRQLSRALSS